MSPPTDPPVADPHRLRRQLGLAQVTASGVGIIIGAGIYVLLGAATAKAGAAVWAAFAVAGLLSALTALSYAELAAMFPSAGAEYEYTRRVAPAWLAFLVGWVMIAGLVVAAGAVALGFGRYFRYFVDVPAQVAAAALVVVVTGIALVGIRQSAAITLAFSLVQVGGLVLVSAVGVPHLGSHSLVEGAAPAGLIAGGALVFFAFIGFDEVITLSEETRDPVRTIPRGLLLALGISTFLYMAVAVSGVSVLGADGLASAEQPLAAVLQSAVGDASASIVALIALVATTNTTLLLVTASSRLQFGMARTRALPAVLGAVSRRGVPWVAVLLAAGVALAGVAVGDLTLIASVTDLAVYLVFIAVNVVVIVLRFRQPHRLRRFRVPWSVGRVPVPTVGALLVVLVLLPGLELSALLLGVVMVALGGVVHLLVRGRVPPPTSFPAPDVGDDGAVFRRTQVSLDDVAQVAAALGVDFDAVEWDLAQLHMGIVSELGHGRVDPDTNVTDDDLALTAKIALAHLHQIPDYYTRLEAMEAEAFAEQERRSHGDPPRP